MIGLRKKIICRWLFLCLSLGMLTSQTSCTSVKIVRVPVPIPTFGLGASPKANKKITQRETHPKRTFRSKKSKLNQSFGVASWYGKKFHQRPTASGEPFDMYKYTAAHPTLPFGTQVRVTNLENSRECVVRINDRGPFNNGRLIDVSYGVASKLDFVEKGTAQVKIEVL